MKISESSQTENRYTDNRFIMLPTVDVCFKGLMNNPIVRKGFIAALLKADPETIAETTLLPTILHQDYPDDKLGILDVRVLMENGTQIDMEMQVAYFEYWDARVLFYLSRIFTDQLRKGESYENLKKCIHVSILDFIHFKEDDKCHRTICFCDEKTGRKYTDLMEIQILELRKLPENLKNDSDILNWMRFLGGKTQRLIYNRKYNPHLKSLSPFGFRFQFKIHLPGNFPGQIKTDPGSFLAVLTGISCKSLIKNVRQIAGPNAYSVIDD